MTETGFEPLSIPVPMSSIILEIRKPGNVGHLARPAEGYPCQDSSKGRLLQVLAGKLEWPVTVPGKPWGPKAEFPQQNLPPRPPYVSVLGSLPLTLG